MIGELVGEPASKRAEYAKRNRTFDEETFENPLREAREAQGWSVVRENKTTLRMAGQSVSTRFWRTDFGTYYIA
jgi:hypothetical protein